MSALTYKVQPGGTLRGAVTVPGDKSVSHRSVILGAIARGVTRARGFLASQDTLGTAAALRSMGVDIVGPRDGCLTIHGAGMRALRPPGGNLDLGNSGTAMRLLPGILAGQAFACRLVGDDSLMRRPMRRITDPLTSMGARVRTSPDGTPPLDIEGRGDGLRAIDYRMPVASAQVKSCLLLAGLYARGVTGVAEEVATRDHTERMLRAFGAEVWRDDGWVRVEGGCELGGCEVEVPGDISSAAFLMVGAAIAADADVTLPGVGVNPTRTGIIDILRLMGADIEVTNQRLAAGGQEPIADLRVRSAELSGCRIPPALVPAAIDEFPAILVAAACARGVTVLTGARELRVKESDRIAAMAAGLVELGIDAAPREDGMRIVGGRLRGGRVSSRGDHRIAMAFAMGALAASGTIIVDDCANVATSFPDFPRLATASGLALEPAEQP